MAGNSVLEIAGLAPPISGGISRAPLGTTLPTNTTTALDAGFVSLGYVDDDGVTLKEDRPTNKQYAWGGDLVEALQEHYAAELQFKLYQVMNADVLKAAHSDSNVTVTAATQSAGTLTAVKLNSKLTLRSAWVVEGFYQSALMRIAIPVARITAIGDRKITHKNLMTYDVTLTLFPNPGTGDFGIQYWNDGIVAP